MAVKDKLISNEVLKAVNDNMQGQVTDLKSAFDNAEMSWFTANGYNLNIPKLQIPYKSGERYIYKTVFIALTAGEKYFFNFGGGSNNKGIRISYLASDGSEISGTTYGVGLYVLNVPAATAKVRLYIYALTNAYASEDGVAVFENVTITDYTFGKSYNVQEGKYVNENGFLINYTGRRAAYFFKGSITVLKAIANQYTYAWIYDAPDFSSYTGQSIEIPTLQPTTVTGKYIALYGSGASSADVFVDYDEQIEKDARDFNVLINTAQDAYSRFIWLSDSHANYRDPAVTDSLDRAKADMRFCADNVMIDFVLHTGDLVAQSQFEQLGNVDAIRLMSNELDGLKKIGRLVYAVGNHDGLSVNSDNKNTTLYAIGYDFENKGRQYYYFDNDGLGVRYIVLANPDDNYYGLSKTQLDWLSSDALNTNYNVVVIIHITPVSGGYNFNRLADILNAYTDKTSGSGTVYGGEVVTWDFTGSTSGKVMVVLGGHTHNDTVIEPLGTNNPFKCSLVIIRNTYYSSSHGDVAYTDKSYAYDLACLNLTKQKLYLYRRGNGENREVDLVI